MKPLTITINEFLKLNKKEFIDYLTRYIESHDLPLGEGQINAWDDCYEFLQKQFVRLDSKFLNTYMIFEYMLPLEKYRRPDVILLFEKSVAILEFKQKREGKIKDIEQAIGYREDIRNFHSVTARLSMETRCFLVTTLGNINPYNAEDVCMIGSNSFLEKVFIEGEKPLDTNLARSWVESIYEPIPDVIAATQRLFFEGDLPYIKSIVEGDISKTVKVVRELISENENRVNGKRIIFVSGVPGAGKTLVAVKTLYEYNKSRFKEDGVAFGGVYLSGNGPLVSVLRHQLSDSSVNGVEGKAYIRGMLEYKREYLEKNQKVPSNTLILFDEAQRAWDKEKMKKPYSESSGLLKIGERIKDKEGYVTLVCFVGDGQSIHKGEEKGMALWVDALKMCEGWEVYVPPKYLNDFKEIRDVKVEDSLFLDTSIRCNFIDTSKFIEGFLSLDIEVCKKEIESIKKKGLILRVTRSFENLVEFSKELDKVKKNDNYGLLISSKCKPVEDEVKKYTSGYFKSSFVKDVDAAKWFFSECKKLNIAASEFLCQGLEIDFPFVVFGGDYYIKNGEWAIRPIVLEKNRGMYENIKGILENIYRVLLSRARKGMVIVVPDRRGFDETYRFLRECGIEEL